MQDCPQKPYHHCITILVRFWRPWSTSHNTVSLFLKTTKPGIVRGWNVTPCKSTTGVLILNSSIAKRMNYNIKTIKIMASKEFFRSHQVFSPLYNGTVITWDFPHAHNVREPRQHLALQCNMITVMIIHSSWSFFTDVFCIMENVNPGLGICLPHKHVYI